MGADEDTAVAREVIAALREAGHSVEAIGPPAGGQEEWVHASAAAARRVAAGDCERAVVLCWSGTGASIAANKVPGVRAALCTDAPTARMAREYNRANVLALSMRLTSPPLAREILEAFLDEPDGTGEFNDRNLSQLALLDGPAMPDLEWPEPTTGREALWWDDLEVGMRFAGPPLRVDAEALIAFAHRYDPQPFHTDPAAAEGLIFGGLVASGWHTTAITMRLFVDHGPLIHGGLVGLGVEELRWRALQPGESVYVECEVLERRRSRSGQPRGTARLRVRTLGERGGEVQHMVATLLVPAREP